MVPVTMPSACLVEVSVKEILFQPDPGLPASLQSQLREKIVTAILSRALQPGERLPSSRKLASLFGIARNTVTLAYQALTDDGYLEARPRSGYVVSADAPVHPPNSGTDPAGQSNIDWRKRMVFPNLSANMVRKPLNWREYKFPFVYGQADFSLFSHSEWRECARQALGARDFGTLAGDYGQNDDPLLVDYITSHSLPQRGIYMKSENVLVTLGAQNALYLICELLVDQNSRVVMENPGYPDLRGIVSERTSNIHYLPVDKDGLVPDERVLNDCDILFITPSHQCPTTATMPTERRKRLLELAEKHDFIIVEDDYEYEMNFLSAPLPAMKTLDEGGRVIYVGSFSKSLFPGLRLGYMGAASEVIAEARNLRHLMLRHPPGHSQRTAAYFMALGHYSAQMHKLKNSFAKRREVMAAALERHGLHNRSAAHFGGTSFWIEAPGQLDSDQFADELEAASVLIEPGTPFFGGEHPRSNYFRIAYSSIDSELIDEGVGILADVMEKHLG